MTTSEVQVASETLKTIGLVAGGAFFLYKWALGYLMINATLVVATQRTRQPNDIDLIKISATIKKGDRECLQLNKLCIAVEGTCNFIGSDSTDFFSSHAPSGRLRLSPGEETTYETVVSTGRDQVLKIKTSLRGTAGPFFEFIPAYWEVTNMSIPDSPPPEA